jgi:hypothetical protein
MTMSLPSDSYEANVPSSADITLRSYPLPTYTYESLEPRCIRLLELHPGNDTDPFEGHFTVASIDTDVKYDALSYMWGDPDPVDTIIIGGATVPLAANLATALKYLRNLTTPKPLLIWIDAICINQSDLAECGDQVAMMRLVY